MRVFACALVAVVVLAVTAHFALNSIQESTALASTTEGTRLNQQESVNDIGREG